MTPSSSVASSYGKQLLELEHQIRSQWSWPSPESGFALHVFHAARLGCPVQIEDLWSGVEPPTYAQTLAATGYALSVSPEQGVHSRSWGTGLDRLTGRDAFPADRQSFAFRPLEVLGITLGAASCEHASSDGKEWLRRVITRLARDGNTDAWSIGLYGAAASVLGVPWKELSTDFSDSPPHVLALFKWLVAAYEKAAFLEPLRKRLSDLDKMLLLACALGDPIGLDVGQAAVLSYALRRTVSERIESEISHSWQVNRETTDALTIVTNLCRRFHLFAKQLQVRRKDVPIENTGERRVRSTIEMKDEYDVQDAMHALLKLHFDDVRPEEHTPSRAGGQARMDFLLKKEKIVVEAKRMRPGLTQIKVATELAEDRELYQAHPDCQTLVCFVYDPDGVCNNPAALENDVQSDRDGFRVILIVSPRGL